MERKDQPQREYAGDKIGGIREEIGRLKQGGDKIAEDFELQKREINKRTTDQDNRIVLAVELQNTLTQSMILKEVKRAMDHYLQEQNNEISERMNGIIIENAKLRDEI